MVDPLPHSDHISGQGVSGQGDPREYLQSRINYERQTEIPYRSRSFKLERMERLLARLACPHLGMPIVHVAGTKGKGSMAAMLASCLRSAGYRTGLYTSPHLSDVTERFQVDGMPCQEADFGPLVEQLRMAVEEVDRELASDDEDYAVTYFEIVTAPAFLHFQQQDVDVAVVEVGLGGRLDSTNVCLPAVTVITPISLDHTEQLGETLAEIAFEKAGIIKPRVPVICGPQAVEASEVIERVAQLHDAPCLRAGRDFEYFYEPPDATETLGTVRFEPLPGDAWDSLRQNQWPDSTAIPSLATERCFREPYRLGLSGRHQAANAATALAALEVLESLGFVCSDRARAEGLRQATCPARIEVMQHDPLIVIDAAHNEASVQALVETLQWLSRSRRGKRRLVFATSRDKNAAEMLKLLVPHFDFILLTEYSQNQRATPVASLLEAARASCDGFDATQVEVCSPAELAWQKVRKEAQPQDLICVAGSFFLAAEIRPLVTAETVHVQRQT